MPQKWVISGVYNPTNDLAEQILLQRGITDIKAFLNPPTFNESFKLLPEEFVESLKSATKIIKDAIAKETPIIIHGDYDADGVCATAILFNTLKKELNYQNTFFFIPNRFVHSYGLTELSIDDALKLVSGKRALIVTVDGGITANDAVDYAKKIGQQIIITDHHQKPAHLPNADEIVWSDSVVGAALAWILSKSLGSKSKAGVALAALATVTDIQPLLGFNRAIVKAGLSVINTEPPLGLAQLIKTSGNEGKKISNYELGWVIGPRINATGRLIDAVEAVKLFTEEDPSVVEDIAQKLHEINIDRQDKTLQMYELAGQFDLKNLPKVVIAYHEDFHEGIIGLVAAKITQKYYRPSIVMSINEEMAKGSVRSVPGVDIIAFLRNFEDMFESLGGHPGAAGFSINKNKITELEGKVVKLANSCILDDDLVRTVEVDIELPLEAIDIELVQNLEKLQPFGVGNREPVFAVTGVKVKNIDIIGKSAQHVKLTVTAGKKDYKAIYFNGKQACESLCLGDIVDLAFTLKINEFNNKRSVDLVVVDIKIP
ncbi:single-stranded-DNA-specific exonuclease RecJ [candidate division WWE3 bacterium RIFOXYC1_FULL_40_10]|uniref:Single-stranded-DNA-specific exonuclease RecJ n=1 Tax=candidate division WWE3 bacterium RIFOXYA2_FULL_46_9 TaxID=1802636 RepID=A0A1F4VYW6_UNCKA|nr:MAG: single-stranded-DNA-specific exonuclease RecJ [candidate division WWE3 bacterium RIFOXYB1_FULL_40_22]OGC61924.1 MAG: single-stranded-DNA-specific exonuclease RecJ [candidate division WWE3 bacterium RIFOXYA1_FULL_40_11]OGC62290.1 MAG: single-stranded-DNA-specific exonuclease RecJ [candidate division WWE3 bacterium RIFOXYA2_FULL_46_9]OGC65099.1 MAG: single-stranded-DNA-specific exonuclease RecJ [candidate division WWE3 bacterium RIFOXYB2_FULL_41_6]OGC66307.1 MAG: single-stranded-DNA-speci